MELAKPASLFARDAEWRDLATFCTDASLGSTLAVVSGRRRQGKTLMLELLTERTGGYYLQGFEQSSAQNLAAVSRAFGAFENIRAPVGFTSWEQVVTSLLALGERGGPASVVIDELPYLMRTAPEIPSILQRALSPRGRARQRGRARLILCGSTFSVMTNLLGGTAPLRGRASREIVLHPFDFREAASFWGIERDPDLAVRLHALVGGTPAYRDFCNGDLPGHGVDLNAWVERQLLNPSSAFHREGRVLLAEEPEINELSLYFSVLSAIADGKTRRGQIAEALGRKESALAHPLGVLEDAHLIERRFDALRANRSSFHIAEPMLRLHQLVIAPNEPRLNRRQARQVWNEIADVVATRIYSPHFEELARQWTGRHAGSSTAGGLVGPVARTTVACAEHRRTHEIDVVAVERIPAKPNRVALIGEAKWRTELAGIGDLERLRHIRSIMGSADGSTKLALFSRSGFSRELLRATGSAGDVELVDLVRLYTGD